MANLEGISAAKPRKRPPSRLAARKSKSKPLRKSDARSRRPKESSPSNKEKRDGEDGEEELDISVSTKNKVSLTTLSGLAPLMKVGGKVGIAGIAGYVAYRMYGIIRARRSSSGAGGSPRETKKSKKPKKELREYEIKVDAMESFTKIMSKADDSLLCTSGNGTTENFDQNKFQKAYTVLIFDCDLSLKEAADKKARTDYFELMANLTQSAQSKASGPMEIIYIPGNGNENVVESSSKTYHSWAYLSSKSRSHGLAVARALRSKYDVRSEELRIMVVDSSHGEEGKVITENALDLLRVDPLGMPWIPSKLNENLQQGGLLEGNGGNITENISMKGKKTAIYFSASWCAPCKTFTPKLKEAYAAFDLEKNNADVLFVSLDQEEEAFDTYRASMPWPAVPFRDARRATLQMGLGVKSIPALIVIDENGVVLTGSGVTPITKNATLAELFENKNEVMDLSGSAVEIIQRHPVCIALTDQSDGVAKANAKKIMQTMTDNFSCNPTMTPRSPREDTVFCILQENDKLAQAIRSLCNLSLEKEIDLAGGKQFDVVLLDLSKEEFAVMSDIDATSTESLKGVQQFYKKYRAYGLPMEKVQVGDASPQ
jgi:thiol-disulfide isomerase/thioredoxin